MTRDQKLFLIASPVIAAATVAAAVGAAVRRLPAAFSATWDALGQRDIRYGASRKGRTWNPSR
jgi:hypothetical protein